MLLSLAVSALSCVRVEVSSAVLVYEPIVNASSLGKVLIRPAELEALRRGEIDLAFRRWDRPRVKVGTRLRTAVGLLEVVSVDRVSLSSLRAEDALRAGARSLSALKDALAMRP